MKIGQGGGEIFKYLCLLTYLPIRTLNTFCAGRNCDLGEWNMCEVYAKMMGSDSIGKGKRSQTCSALVCFDRNN